MSRLFELQEIFISYTSIPEKIIPEMSSDDRKREKKSGTEFRKEKSPN